MYIKKIYIKGFRNFKEVTVNFEKHCLLIGANDVGKTNLIQALRILLDRSFSDYDYELKESDFFAYKETNEIIIKAYLSDVVEDCVLARMKGKISDEGELVLQYTAKIENGKVDYQFYCGKDEQNLDEIDSPYYRKYLNLKYIGSKREFWNYINKTKNELLLQAKESRTEAVIVTDDNLYKEIKEKLEDVDNRIPQLSYVKNATEHLNKELNKLSIHNTEQQIVFDTASTNVDKVISNVSITSKYREKKLFIGGEGRINQIYLSLWALQNQYTSTSNEVSIICVEEPEAYLHPHQQRELASYLGKVLNGQVLLTTHSPYIVSEFSPNYIIRLFRNKEHCTCIASDGCSKIIGEAFEDFGYRMSVIPAETFFSDCVLLVEGTSEVIFYKTLAKQLKIELDRLNISILDVGGVGFETYIDILNSLHINWILRTDNDISKIPKKEEYRYAGVERGLSFINKKINTFRDLEEINTKKDLDEISTNKNSIHNFNDKENIPNEIKQAASTLIRILKKYDIFIAKEGLEEDLYNSLLKSKLEEFYNEKSPERIIESMKKQKAVNMYDFLKKHKESLSILEGDDICLPLKRAKEYIEKNYGTY